MENFNKEQMKIMILGKSLLFLSKLPYKGFGIAAVFLEIRIFINRYINYLFAVHSLYAIYC